MISKLKLIKFFTTITLNLFNIILLIYKYKHLNNVMFKLRHICYVAKINQYITYMKTKVGYSLLVFDDPDLSFFSATGAG